MRFMVLALVAGSVALVAAAGRPDTAAAEKTKLGCDKAAEMWDAGQGKCVPGQSKWRKPPPAPQPAATQAPPKKMPAKKGAKAPAKKK
jgi:hypothetical protein